MADETLRTHFAQEQDLHVSILAVILLISVTIALLARWILISGLTKELELRGIAVAHSIAERGGGFVLDKNYSELLSLIFEEARLRERQHMINYIYRARSQRKGSLAYFYRAFSWPT